MELYLETTVFNYYFETEREYRRCSTMIRNEADRELHQVREELYQQTIDMSVSERVAYFKSLSAPVLEEFGIQTVRGTRPGAGEFARVRGLS